MYFANGSGYPAENISPYIERAIRTLKNQNPKYSFDFNRYFQNVDAYCLGCSTITRSIFDGRDHFLNTVFHGPTFKMIECVVCWQNTIRRRQEEIDKKAEQERLLKSDNNYRKLYWHRYSQNKLK